MSAFSRMIIQIHKILRVLIVWKYFKYATRLQSCGSVNWLLVGNVSKMVFICVANWWGEKFVDRVYCWQNAQTGWLFTQQQKIHQQSSLQITISTISFIQISIVIRIWLLSCDKLHLITLFLLIKRYNLIIGSHKLINHRVYAHNDLNQLKIQKIWPNTLDR